MIYRYAFLHIGERMNWEDGKLFLAVARAGQMLSAAKSLGVNQATLSRRMTALEHALGARLLIRRTTGCDLTEDGHELLGHLEKAEGAFIASQSLSKSDGVTGTVRIGAPDGFGSLFLAPRLAELQTRHPGLSVQLVPVPRSFSLSQREADIAIMIGRPTQGRLVARKLTDYSLSLYAGESYLRDHDTPQTPHDLLGHQLVGYVDDLLYAPSLNFTDAFASGWKSSIEIATAVGQIEAINGGAGIGIVHDFLAGKYPALHLLLPDRQITRSYWTVIHENMRDLPRIQVVAAFLAEIITRNRRSFLREVK
jgi:DNA-binding transcriptional LysR family regulator